MKMESEAIDKIHNLRHSKSWDLANQVLWFTSWEIPSDVFTCPDISPNFLECLLTALSIWHYTTYLTAYIWNYTHLNQIHLYMYVHVSCIMIDILYVTHGNAPFYKRLSVCDTCITHLKLENILHILILPIEKSQ